MTFLPVFFLDFFAQKNVCVANGAQNWQMSAHKFGLNFVGEIEWRFFHHKLCATVFSFVEQTLVKSTPSAQFHQRSTFSFYARGSQKRNYSVKSSVSFTLLGSTSAKAVCKNVDEIEPWFLIFAKKSL